VIGLAVLNRELLIPRFRDELSRKPQELATDVPRPFDPQYDERSDVLIRGQAAITAQQRIEKPALRLPPSLDQHIRQITAREAYYEAPTGDRPGGYLLVGIEQPKDLAAQPSLTLGDGPVIITARDAPTWLRPDQCFLVSDVSFEQLTNGDAWREFSSTSQLIRGLHNRSLNLGGDIRATIHARIVQPLLDVVLLFLGLPLVMNRENRNVFLAMALCAVVTMAFLLVVIVCQKLGGVYALGLSPALGVWLPLMIFAPVAVELAISMND